MAATQQDIDDLEAALFSGALTVEYRDKKVTYRSQEEMRALLRSMRAELNPPASTTTRYSLSTFDRGYQS